ncbi:MAG: adenosylcobinamide-GDP ribazoletransferase [Ruminococcus sp.]|nr:adenosylcobinamide-GDP ribazoletransferase [Ruminococcus sp.]
MRILKSFLIAFSTYSKIPVPVFGWEEENMKYIYCFFPWVGAVIGICFYFWNVCCGYFQIGEICRLTIGLAIPLLITGGFHVDGFMDTMDALHSYQEKERKLEILKDSHIGAFAVIMLAAYGLIVLGALSEIKQISLLKIVCAGFFLSRCLCGISAVTFPLARKGGMLYLFADRAHKRIVKGSLYLQSSLCILFMLSCSPAVGALVTVAAFLAFFYYDRQSRKEFGGVTGDTAGYFILLCEGVMIVAAAAGGYFFK